MTAVFEVLFILIIILVSLNAKKGKKEDARKSAGYGTVHDRGRVQSTLTQVDPGENRRSLPTVRGQAYSSAQPSRPLPGQTARHALESWKRNLTEADGPSRFDRDSLNYCDSDLPVTDGISFKELPPGADELEMLIRHNRQREQQLEHALQIRE